MKSSINLKEALCEQRDHSSGFVQELRSLLSAEAKIYRSLENRLDIKGEYVSDVEHELIQEMFELSDIRTVAIRYGLRFLDSDLYKGNIPIEALQEVRKREQKMGSPFVGFRILGPSEVFQLEDENADPLFFGELSDGRYELLAQWGNDLSWYRGILRYPSRNVLTLIGTVVLIALAVCALTPEKLVSISGMGEFPLFRSAYFFFVLTFLSGVTSYIWFAFRKQFTSNSWNSKSF